ncbi:putative DNA-directed RNA polymerase II chain Rpb7 [Tilletiaria anomala UBC 951]|uniref:Putative DNA-directed RNA polymerase II chain Rpb7 n=1 Tax=Tilletiaria anomala (strain ATCC 24038 / CBS 436.72 / UBC 951) TaxID=1037660 RepID=A0A066W318_TILAU|nr:putative DNA-directed RNA polymerase II chain Rpb7 [Tilletiaria anomala UBC 951]KDN45479.1 putative DNA-directed RNA polymerase II chain Rpb7 [Tilletiaria anomala UBC 951]
MRFALQKELKHTINLHPSFFGPSMQQFLEAKLRDDVEGTCTGRYGYIIRVVAINDIGEGIVKPGSGLAEFRSKYSAIVMKPFKGEVVDALVTNVNKMGFFASVGPLSIFTSTHLLPVEYQFQADSNPPEFASPEASLTPGIKVRLRIVGTRVDANEVFAIGTMKEDFLGPID